MSDKAEFEYMGEKLIDELWFSSNQTALGTGVAILVTESKQTVQRRGYIGVVLGLNLDAERISILKNGERLTIQQVERIEAALGPPKARGAGETEKLINAARDLVQYRAQAGPLNFQLEKADDFIRTLHTILDAMGEANRIRKVW